MAIVVKDERAAKSSSALVNVYPLFPFIAERAKGLFVYDNSGREYLDFYGGHAVSLLGHCPDEVVAAIAEQGQSFMFWSNLMNIPIRERAASDLLDFLQSGHKKIFFCNSGGEANENALKTAIKLSGRSMIVAFRGGFHGRTMLAIGATDHPDWHAYLSGWMGEVAHIEPNDTSGFSAIDEKTAAVILEPIQSIGGVTEFRADFLAALQRRVQEVGAYLIFDEVQTGVGRTGVPCFSGHCGVTPDMMTMAKGLAGGFPIGAVAMSETVANKLQLGDLGATFGGSPMAMAAMQATLRIIRKQKLIEHALWIGDYVKERFSGMPHVREVRGRGCLLGIVVDREASEVQSALFSKGIIIGTNSNKNLLHLLPPLTIQKEHVDCLYTALEQILSE